MKARPDFRLSGGRSTPFLGGNVEARANTLVYPGHDYISNNLGFTMDREPDNAKAASLLDGIRKEHDPAHPLVTSLGLEKQINTFFRLTSKTVIERLREAFPDLPANPSQKDVFVRLRELRNSW